jgi:hypothetical protein
MKQLELEEMEQTDGEQLERLRREILDEGKLNEIIEMLGNLKTEHYSISINKIKNKLNRLYRGVVILGEKSNCYMNLSDTILTTNQDKFLNLGLNCHL